MRGNSRGDSWTEARMEPPGPAGACHRASQRPDPLGRPDDKLSVIRDGLTPDYAALHPGYKAATARDGTRHGTSRGGLLTAIRFCCLEKGHRATAIACLRSARPSSARHATHGLVWGNVFVAASAAISSTAAP